ncbi:MAG: SPOR domain-containing protein, partial [Proteobacteria bacterium]|nr:SPOR domain-containing protein [Pseudomonadota bacterium]
QSGRELHLVQVGAFNSDKAARAWCADLLSTGVDCFVVQP